jgi:hypothetical protein
LLIELELQAGARVFAAMRLGRALDRHGAMTCP